MKPLAIDLFCGLGGWTEGLLAEGYRVVGFDIERHVYGEHRYPGQLVLQDVLTLHGSQFRDAALIVASPPCQAYSYRAMPWKRAKALPPPDNTLFEACFRIQREACEATGRFIPLVVENVRGAEKWVGPAAWHFGSFYLWGDVPLLMPAVSSKPMKNQVGGSWFWINGSGQAVKPNSARDRIVEAIKQPGLSGPAWFDRGAAAFSSRSSMRRMASALIAKIPLALSRHIARTYLPVLLLLALPCAAQSMKPLRLAEATFAAGAAVDIASSWGREELNPLLGRGTFGPRQAAISVGISAGAVLLAEVAGRKWPKMRRPLAVTLFVMGGVRGGSAVRNWRMR